MKNLLCMEMHELMYSSCVCMTSYATIASCMAISCAQSLLNCI